MAEPHDMVPEMLRRIQSTLDDMREDDKEFRTRLGRLEVAVAVGFGSVNEHLAEHSVRMDRMHDRLLRIERRLDLVEV